MGKVIIFDSGTLISLSMNGLFVEIRRLKEIFKGKFIITREVKEEIIDKPLKTKRFELEGLKLKQLLDEKVLELPLSLGISDKEIDKKTNEIVNIANSTFIAKGKEIHIIDSGEASCLALSEILNKKKIENVIAVDERTTRILGERPENLEKLFRRKLHTKIKSKRENYRFFKGFKFIRSAELVYVVYKKNLIRLESTALLDALLYAVKFKGCSISDKEIVEIKKIG
ncbi:MAG: hypothetical protein QF567_02445 [Candidatus Pacearchaeota archaeon]|jgi:hypothetical protein|nr:hypothetical protein [Candidatus Pacearchaeota archaeon]MDP7521066.1 hypothetical protein [Candidatus Pacearchaeota archaeon]|tara:strand:- start:439 stop:1119 length:681 start_codon:yes stop_codon:yes gene_type:complete